MRVTQYLIVVPVFVQVSLSLTVWFANWLAEFRGSQAERLAKASKKQFELPLLFYSAGAFAYSFRLVDVWQLVMALGFVAAFALGTALEIFSDKPTPVAVMSAIAALAVAGMWIKIALHFATAGF